MKVPFITRNCPACSFPCHKRVHFPHITHLVVSHGCWCQLDKSLVQKTPGCCLWLVPGAQQVTGMRILQLVNAVANKQPWLKCPGGRGVREKSCLLSEIICPDEGTLLFFFRVPPSVLIVWCLSLSWLYDLHFCQCPLGARPAGRGSEAHGADGG